MVPPTGCLVSISVRTLIDHLYNAVDHLVMKFVKQKYPETCH